MKGTIRIAVVVMIITAFMLAAMNVMAAEEGKKAATPKQQAQQEKMKACSADAKAKGLKGDERKKFMSECLKAAP
jgi:hypothetical protein